MAQPPSGIPEETPGAKPLEPVKGFETKPSLQPDQEVFQSFFEAAPGKIEKAPFEASTPLSLEKAGVSLPENPTFESLNGQIQSLDSSFSTLESQLKYPNLTFKTSHERLLENKFQDASNQLSSLSEKIGAPVLPETVLPESSGPVTRFISYITDGQNQLLEAKNRLTALSQSGKQLQPAEMLLIQIKIAQAQQLLEYSSILLSKIIDALQRTISQPIG